MEISSNINSCSTTTIIKAENPIRNTTSETDNVICRRTEQVGNFWICNLIKCGWSDYANNDSSN